MTDNFHSPRFIGQFVCSVDVIMFAEGLCGDSIFLYIHSFFDIDSPYTGFGRRKCYFGEKKIEIFITSFGIYLSKLYFFPCLSRLTLRSVYFAVSSSVYYFIKIFFPPSNRNISALEIISFSLDVAKLKLKGTLV